MAHEKSVPSASLLKFCSTKSRIATKVTVLSKPMLMNFIVCYPSTNFMRQKLIAHNHYFLHAVISSALKVEAFLDHHPPRNQPTNRSTSSRTPFTYNPPPSYLDPVTSHPPPPTQNDPSSSSASNPFTRSSLDKCFKYGKFGHRSHEYCSHVALVTPDAPHGDDDAFDTVDGCSSSFWKCG